MTDITAAIEPQYGTPERINLLLAEQERIFSWKMLGHRWGCHEKVAARRWKAFGLPVIRFNERTAGARLSDILKVEAQSLVSSTSIAKEA
jgi:hypothetical protein